MNKDQRNALRLAVEKARKLLEKEFSEQLEGIYNIVPKGEMPESCPGDPVVRAKLLQLIEHYESQGQTRPAAIAQAYETGGAQALSVLMHHEFIGGGAVDYSAVRAAVGR